MKVKKTISFMKYLFTLLGLIGFTISAYFTFQQIQFEKKALPAQGQVIDIHIKNRTTRRNGHTKTTVSYYPVIQFISKDGSPHQFTSAYTNNSFEIGDPVGVLYDSENPNKAMLDNFGSRFFIPSLVGIFGLIFFSIGGGIIFYGIYHRKKIQYLMQNGIPISAKFLEVTLDTRTKVNGQHPYRIKAEWINPDTQTTHTFFSDRLWSNPTSFIKTEKLKVLIEPNNPKKYHMDISFIPEIG